MTTAPRRLSLGRLLAGVLLVGVGTLWLVEEFTDVNVPWSSVLPLILILIGIVLMVGASTGRHGGLVALGVVVSAIVVLSSAIDVLVDVPFSGGVGDNDIKPVTLESEYRWAIGSMTVDLTEVASPSGTVEMSVGIGELVIVVPDGVVVSVQAEAGLGEVVVFDDVESGISPSLDVEVPAASYRIIARIGIGKIEVRHP